MNDNEPSGDREGVMAKSHEGHIGKPPIPFSRASLLLLRVILPLLAVVITYTSPLTAGFLPVLLLPTFILLRFDRMRPHDQRTDPETLLWTYVLTGAIGTTAVLVVQSIVSYGVAWLLFRSETGIFFEEFSRQEGDVARMDDEALAARRAMAYSWKNWAFLFVLAFVAAGAVEEMMKYYGLQYARRYGRVAHPMNYITLAMAASLGFSTVEGIGFVYVMVQDGQTLDRIVLTVLERVVHGPPTHALGAGLIGLNVIRRDVRGERLSLPRVTGLSALFHGGFNFVVMGVSALQGNVGWIHPRGKTLLLVLAFTAGFFFVLLKAFRSRFSAQVIKIN